MATSSVLNGFVFLAGFLSILSQVVKTCNRLGYDSYLCDILTVIDNLRSESSTQETLSRWVLKGVPLLVGIGIVAGLALRISFGLPFARSAIPIAVLVAIQGALFISMYWVRQRYKRNPDLRGGIMLFGSYGLLIGLAGMYYAGQLGLVGANTLNENYLEFSVFMLVVIAISVGMFSFLKPKRLR
jgi:hypothetical protein